MVMQGTIRRFAHWGLTHGPAWGVLAALVGGIPLAMVHGTGADELQIVGPACSAVSSSARSSVRRSGWPAPPRTGHPSGSSTRPTTSPSHGHRESSAPSPGRYSTSAARACRSEPSHRPAHGAPAIDAARSAPWLLHPTAAGHRGAVRGCRAAASGVVVERHHGRGRVRLAGEHVAGAHLVVLQREVALHVDLAVEELRPAGAADAAFAGERRVVAHP